MILKPGGVTVRRLSLRIRAALGARYMLREGTRVLSCDHVHECTCSNMMVSRYQKRLSGPLADRIDIHIEVPRVRLWLQANNRANVNVRTCRHHRHNQTAWFGSDRDIAITT